MKRIKYLFTFLLLIIIPSIVSAFTYLESSIQNPIVGSSIYIQLNVDYQNKNNPDLKIKDFHIIINYDPNYFKFGGLSWTSGANSYSVDEKNGKVYIDKEDNGRYWDTYISPVVIKFTTLKAGIKEFSVSRNGDSHYNTGDIISQSFSGVTINTVEPSTNTQIGTLYVEGYTLTPTFSKTKYEYYLTVPSNVDKVNIVATSSDNKQTITGDGTVELSYGKNVKKILVKAENGASSVYTITITRIDSRTGDTSLKSLSVSGTNIRYEEGKTIYEATVGKSTDKVLISATATDSNALLTGTGEKELKIGENVFTVNVSSSNNKETNYEIRITRSTEEIEVVEESSKLKSLIVYNMNINLDNEDNYTYLIGVSNDIKTLPLTYNTLSSTATVKVTGDTDLKEGINLIKIKVTEVNEEETEYRLLVYRNLNDTMIIDNLDNLSNTVDATGTNLDLVYYSKLDSAIISSNIISYLNSYDRTLYYNKVNEYNGLLYQVVIPSDLLSNEFKLEFNNIESNYLEYQTNLPKNTEVTLYVGDTYSDNTSIKIFSYNENEKYKLVTDGILVKNGYVTFNLNGDTNYVFTTKELISMKDNIKDFINNYLYYLIGGLCFLVVIFIIVHKNKKKKIAETKNEPLY